ncbi:MAG: ABC transporter ATP-binding protein [Pseudomonadota bacterium]
MGSIQLQGVEKWFGDLQVIKGIDLKIADGEFVIFVGPSGCGKSTLLRMIAGLEETSRGSILLDGSDVTDRVPSERELSMVFQSYALYPHMSVKENVGFGLKTAGENRAEIDRKVAHAAEILELGPYLDRRPKALSGGQRQRVAIGRAIVREPKGFLFDEPLSNLDAALRVQMRFEIAKLHDTLSTTMIYVTHDQVEAMTLADKIVVLKDGLIMQVGTPRELYEDPDNLFVAQFIGSPKMNVLPCSANGSEFVLDGLAAGPHGLASDAEEVRFLGIRPEHIKLGEASGAQCSGTVEVVEYLGADTFLYVDLGPLGTVTVRAGDVGREVKGKKVHLHFAQGRTLFFGLDQRLR